MVVRVRFPLEMLLDGALTSMSSSENSAWFWLIGRSCPLQSVQPFGANSKDMILISVRKGSAQGSFYLWLGGQGHGSTGVGCWQTLGPDSRAPEKLATVGEPTLRFWM